MGSGSEIVCLIMACLHHNTSYLIISSMLMADKFLACDQGEFFWPLEHFCADLFQPWHIPTCNGSISSSAGRGRTFEDNNDPAGRTVPDNERTFTDHSADNIGVDALNLLYLST